MLFCSILHGLFIAHSLMCIVMSIEFNFHQSENNWVIIFGKSEKQYYGYGGASVNYLFKSKAKFN